MDIFKICGTIAVKNSDANKALDETDTKAKKASNSITGSFKNISGSGTSTGKNLKQIAEEQGKTINQLRSEVATAAAEYKKSGMTASEAMKKAYADIGYSAEEAKEKNDNFRKSLDETSDSGESSSSRIVEALKKIGAAVAAAFAIDKIKSFGQEIVDVTASFEDGMLKVQSLSGATSEEYDKLTEAALNYGSTTAWTSKDVADAMGYMALAGFDTNEILSSTSGMLSLASASGEDLATATDILTDSMTGFGDSAEDASRYADVLSTVQAKSNTTVGLLGEAFKYVSPLAGSYAYQLEDVSTALGVMANAGVKGSMAGTSLSSIITRLGTNTSNSRDAIEKLGVQFYNSDGTARNLSEVLLDLCDATAEMGAEEKANLANTIAGQEAQKGLLAILNQGSDAYESLRQQLMSCNGTAADMAQNMESGLGGSIRSVQSAFEGMQISLGQKISPGLGETIDKISGFITGTLTPALEKGIDKFTEMKDYIGDKFSPVIDKAKEIFEKVADKVKSLKDKLTDGKSGMELFKGAVDTTASALGFVIDKTSSLIDWLSRHKTLVVTLAAVYGTVKAAVIAYNTIMGVCKAVTNGVAAAQKILNAVMSANPIVLVISIIAALVAAFVLLWNQCDAFREFWIGLWESIQETLYSFFEAWETGWNSIVEFFTVTIPNAWNSFQELFQIGCDSITGFFSGLWDDICGFFGGIGDWFGDRFDEAWDNIQSAFSSVGKFFGDLWDTIKFKFTDIGTKIGDSVSGAFKAVINGALSTVESIINGFFDGINWAIDAINNIPGVNISPIGYVDLPELAEGGVLKKGQTGYLEGDGDEAVVPLERNTGWIDKVAQKLYERRPITTIENTVSAAADTAYQSSVTGKLDRIISLLETFFPQLLSKFDIVIEIDGDRLIAKLMPKIDKSMGDKIKNSERGLA